MRTTHTRYLPLTTLNIELQVKELFDKEYHSKRSTDTSIKTQSQFLEYLLKLNGGIK